MVFSVTARRGVPVVRITVKDVAASHGDAIGVPSIAVHNTPVMLPSKVVDAFSELLGRYSVYVS